MAALTTLDRVKASLRIDFSDDDDQLVALIDAASEMVIRHLKGRAPAVLGVDAIGDSPFVVPALVNAATVMLVGYLFRNPDSDPDKDFEDGLPRPVAALLYTLRDPALA